MKNLTTEIQDVYAAKNLFEKKEKMQTLIENSHAKKETKKLSLLKLSWCKSNLEVDKFATNYMMSGEGLGV